MWRYRCCKPHQPLCACTVLKARTARLGWPMHLPGCMCSQEPTRHRCWTRWMPGERPWMAQPGWFWWPPPLPNSLPAAHKPGAGCKAVARCPKAWRFVLPPSPVKRPLCSRAQRRLTPAWGANWRWLYRSRWRRWVHVALKCRPPPTGFTAQATASPPTRWISCGALRLCASCMPR